MTDAERLREITNNHRRANHSHFFAPCNTCFLLAEVERLRGRETTLELALVKLGMAIDQVFADPERPYRPEDLEVERKACSLSEQVYEVIGAARYDEIEADLAAKP